MLPESLHTTWIDLLTVCASGPTLRHRVAAARELARDIEYRRAQRGYVLPPSHFAYDLSRLPEVSLDPDDPPPAHGLNDRLPKLFFWYDETLESKPHVGGAQEATFAAGAPITEAEPAFIADARTLMGDVAWDAARAPWQALLDDRLDRAARRAIVRVHGTAAAGQPYLLTLRQEMPPLSRAPAGSTSLPCVAGTYGVRFRGHYYEGSTRTAFDVADNWVISGSTLTVLNESGTTRTIEAVLRVYDGPIELDS